MNSRFHPRSLFLFALLSGVLHAEGPALLFRGLLQVDKEVRVGLSTPETQETKWLAVGDEFAGYRIEAVDVAQQALTVSKEGKKIVVPYGALQGAVAETKATEEEAMKTVEGLRLDELVKQTLEQQRVGMEKTANSVLNRMGITATPEEISAYKEKVMTILSTAIPVDELKKDVAVIYKDLFSKEQLAILGDFFGTPAGRLWVEKQQLISQKLQEATMPKMRTVGVQLQAAAAEFYQQQRAKHPAPSPVPGAAPAAGNQIPVIINQVVVTAPPTKIPTPTPAPSARSSSPTVPVPPVPAPSKP